MIGVEDRRFILPSRGENKMEDGTSTRTIGYHKRPTLRAQFVITRDGRWESRQVAETGSIIKRDRRDARYWLSKETSASEGVPRGAEFTTKRDRAIEFVCPRFIKAFENKHSCKGVCWRKFLLRS